MRLILKIIENRRAVLQWGEMHQDVLKGAAPGTLVTLMQVVTPGTIDRAESIESIKITAQW